MAITREELENIANLSKLNVEESEVDKLIADMEKIIDFASEINSAKLDDLEFDSVNGLRNKFREDDVVESFSQQEILKNAKTKEDGFFVLDNSDIL